MPEEISRRSLIYADRKTTKQDTGITYADMRTIQAASSRPFYVIMIIADILVGDDRYLYVSIKANRTKSGLLPALEKHDSGSFGRKNKHQHKLFRQD